ncbi:hypothetical protein [Streptomyces stelliscabiei]|uniref:hypothetical protein n=1 Tax=Streptomyces stelliscabiei TaxID=146820 RepID=UPI002FF1F9BF
MQEPEAERFVMCLEPGHGSSTVYDRFGIKETDLPTETGTRAGAGSGTDGDMGDTDTAERIPVITG